MPLIRDGERLFRVHASVRRVAALSVRVLHRVGSMMPVRDD